MSRRQRGQRAVHQALVAVELVEAAAGEAAILVRAMPGEAVMFDVAGADVQRGEQSRGAAALEELVIKRRLVQVGRQRRWEPARPKADHVRADCTLRDADAPGRLFVTAPNTRCTTSFTFRMDTLSAGTASLLGIDPGTITASGGIPRR